jgi:hypothetical protein
MSENVAKLIGPYWLHLAGLDITRHHWTSAEMPIYLDLRVLDTTSWTVHLQTGSQEVRGSSPFASTRHCSDQLSVARHGSR